MPTCKMQVGSFLYKNVTIDNYFSDRYNEGRTE